jgi:hypothetical protein
MRMISFLPCLAALLTACGGTGFEQPRNPDVVLLTVRNSASHSITATVCGPVACSPARTLSAGATSRFLVQPGTGTRAVVTAKRGDQVVAQKLVDFAPGDRVAIAVP